MIKENKNVNMVDKAHERGDCFSWLRTCGLNSWGAYSKAKMRFIVPLTTWYGLLNMVDLISFMIKFVNNAIRI